MNKLKDKIGSIKLGYVLYGLAIIALIYTIYTVTLSFEYINNMVKQGQASYSANLGEIIQYLINNCGMNLFYTISFFVYGYICINLKKILEKNSKKDIVYPEAISEEIVESISSSNPSEAECDSHTQESKSNEDIE